MTDQSFFHMNVLRNPYQMTNFGFPGPAFMDIRNKEVDLGGCEGMSSTNTRILELRKEKSRDAARSRRGKENYEFYELAKLLPLPAAITSQLDKASIIRLSISYLKLRDFSSHGDPPWNRDGAPPNKSVKGAPPRRRNMTGIAMEIFECHQGTHILQSLDGFGFALSNDGRFLYISETVSIYLGLSQVEMTGSSVFDYVHIKDHPELAEHLGLAMPQGGVPSPGSISDDGSTGETSRSSSPSLSDKACIMNVNPSKGMDRSFCIRMKSTLTKRGVHVKSSGYRVVYILAHHRPQFSFSLNRKQSPPLLGMVAVAIALPPPTITELRMECDTFVMRFSPDLRILYCEPRIADLMDLSAEDITGSSLYDYCHAGDLKALRGSHVDLLRKGQVMTEYYRLMNKHGGFIWIQTCATTICTAKNLEDQNVVAVNYVVSGVELSDCVMNSNQLKFNPSKGHDLTEYVSETASETDFKNQKDNRDEILPSDEPMRESSKVKYVSSSKSVSEADRSRLGDESNIDKLSPTSPSIIDDAVFQDHVETLRLDNKNSRRKMDRPRKRKRESDGTLNGFDSYEGEVTSNKTMSPDTDRISNCENHLSPNLVSSPPQLMAAAESPTPEDLSIKPASSPSEIIITSAVSSTDITTPRFSPEAEWTKSGSLLKTADECMSSSSVKDLEEAMNKHLPILPEGSQGSQSDHSSENMPENQSESSCLHTKQKSTIQWIGSQQSATDPLAASNLLRSLYANRESVIRTNICNSRPQYYTDSMALNMLTPPGNDSYKDPGSLSLHSLHYAHGKSPVSHIPNMSGYSSAPISVSMTTHAADSSYNMTPPSSVSPQEKFVSPFSDASFGDTSVTTQCQTMPESSCQRVHIKPQLYSVPMPAHLPSYTDRSSHLSYPSITSFNSTGSNFPAYSTNSSESNAAWYPTHFATP